jgi:predicted nuclease of restriction endonuclease-like (RecB) superfamily
VRKARSLEALNFYHGEALRGGWSVRQLDRQIASQFYERTALSKNKAAMLSKGAETKPGDALSADEEVRDLLVLEFLGLKDEYSENDLGQRKGATSCRTRAQPPPRSSVRAGTCSPRLELPTFSVEPY